MTAVVAPGPLVRARPAWTSALTGTAGMLRLALRRDRWRLLVWVAGVAVLYLAALGEYAVLADDPRGMQARAVLMRTPAMVTMAGPGYGLDAYTVGAAVANELVLWMVLALAVLSILEVVRHTRAEEESGRSELLRAGAVGRHAPAVAALLLVTAVQAVVAVVTGAVVAAGGGLPAGESFAMTGAVALGALVFAAVALVAAQVAEHGRTATGLSLAVLGAAFAARALGDVQGSAEGRHGSALSWLSPIGWVQQTRVFVDLRWWPLGLCVAATVGLLVVAAVLAGRRDHGGGLVAARRGRADAAASLRGPLAVAWRQQRGGLLWTTLGLGAMWFATGGVLSSLPDMMETLADNPLYAAILGEGDLVRAFLWVIGLYAALGAAAYAVAASLRARAEEQAGRAEYVLATAVSRARWLGAHLAVATVGGVVVLLSGVLALWAGAAATGVTDPAFGELVELGAVYLPALAVLLALGAAVYAWVPRATPLLWALLAWLFVVGMFADLLGLPDWARGVSPYWWVPDPLTEDVDVARLVGLGVVAVVLAAAALVGFRRRDVPAV
ncbi:ABC transporter permease [Puerhibacterium sp. TATVAM-FAB25]|uniref:ABC transporter permease n=1 Tax=Puerhibacterium sp. TATVAM-FAB25 TaxID=3093699 RepID=UPI003978EAEC